MTIPPIPPIGDPSAVGAAAAARQPAEPGFADALRRGLEEVSALEHRADAVATNLAAGGDATVADLMIATSQSQVATDLLLAVRDRAVAAYQEIMRLPI